VCAYGDRRHRDIGCLFRHNCGLPGERRDLGANRIRYRESIAFRLRLQHDLKLSPHDGQSCMDVLAFAILVAPVATIFAVLVFLRITRPARPTNDR
jgi:hypothetical protein